jgi:hypothetical protein
MNLRSVQTAGQDGMPAHSRMDEAVWAEFFDAPSLLAATADGLRTEVREGLLRDPQPRRIVEQIEVEDQRSETYMFSTTQTTLTAIRAEQMLVLAYRAHMQQQGVEVKRGRYWPAGEPTSLASDAWVPDRQLLLEAKNSDSRDAIRLAIGQLFDYRRFHDEPLGLAVLLPYPPGSDRLELLRSAGIEAAWRTRTGFSDSAGRRFV